MPENKTKQNDASVEAFLQSLTSDTQRQDSQALIEIMRQITGEEPKMWGENIIGFGNQHYRYASGREGDWFQAGFSPRKQNLTVYLTYGFEQHEDLMQRIGKVKTGKACLYVKRLADIDLPALKALIERTVKS